MAKTNLSGYLGHKYTILKDARVLLVISKDMEQFN